MIKTSTATLATAYPEAAHAVIAASFGWRVGRISIVEDEDRLGSVSLPGAARRQRTLEGQLQSMTIAIAGRMGEVRAGYRPRRYTAQMDHETAADIALIIAEGIDQEAGKLLQLCELRARRLVDRHWNAIEVLATHLSEVGEYRPNGLRDVLGLAALRTG